MRKAVSLDDVSTGNSLGCRGDRGHESETSDAGAPPGAPGMVRHFPLCSLIMASIFFLTASRLNDAGSCIGGYSIAVLARSATFSWTITNRQNSRAKKSFPYPNAP